MRWYWESGGDSMPLVNGKVVLALNADQLPGGSFPHEIHVTVEWSEGTAGSSALASKKK
jgi:hypothetical protein